MYKIISDNFMLRFVILLAVISFSIYCVPNWGLHENLTPDSHSHVGLMKSDAVTNAVMYSLPINLLGFFIRRASVGKWSISNLKRGFAVESACTIFCVGAILVSTRNFGGPRLVLPWYPLQLSATGIHAALVLYVNNRRSAKSSDS